VAYFIFQPTQNDIETKISKHEPKEDLLNNVHPENLFQAVIPECFHRESSFCEHGSPIKTFEDDKINVSGWTLNTIAAMQRQLDSIQT